MANLFYSKKTLKITKINYQNDVNRIVGEDWRTIFFNKTWYPEALFAKRQERSVKPKKFQKMTKIDPKMTKIGIYVIRGFYFV